jgi:predicted MFS family arabinose efflux permease
MTPIPGERATGFARVVVTCFLPFAAGYLLSYIFRTVNAVVGPRLAAELQIDVPALGVLTSAYFIGFVLLQIPAGVMLDRYGPRRVQTGLLLLAAIGAAIFALSSSLTMLGIGRTLIGAGVAACLMAGFKANTLFWPASRLGTANGVLLSFAGVGGALGTLPVTWLADTMGWRGVFWVLAVAAVCISAIVWRAVPDRRPETAQSLADALGGVREVLTSRAFWRVVPLSATTQAAFQAYHTLWTAPWLVDVAGFPQSAIPGAMLAILLGIIPGYLLSGLVTDLLSARGVPRDRVFSLYAGAFIAIQAVLVVTPLSGIPAVAIWIAYVVLGTGSMIAYVILTPLFPADLAGRVNTAVNLVVFIAAFAMQASIGYVVAALETSGGLSRAGAHATTLAAILLIQAVAWIWLALGRRDLQRNAGHR